MTIGKTKSADPCGEAVVEARRGRGRPQLRSDDETRVLIVEAARQEFAANGFAAASMENVARRAGVSTKTLYRLIPNKAALFETMVTDRIDSFASAIQLRACEGGDVETALAEALLVYAELILDGDVIATQRAILAESEKFPDIAEMFFRKAIKRTEATLASWLRRQRERGVIAIEDAEMTAGILLGMLAYQPQRAVMFGHGQPPSRQEMQRRARSCAALFLQGCRVRATR